MNRICLTLLFTLATLIGFNSNVNAQTPCPFQVGYKSSYDGCINSWGFYILSMEPIPAGNIIISFPGNSNPGCNQSFYNSGYPKCESAGMYYAFDDTPPVCSGFLGGPGFIRFPDNTVCYFDENGMSETAADCLDFIENCEIPLIEFVQNLVEAPQDCKLWEGPCTTDSEIWRSGDVNIGSVVSLDGYKLGVNGGVITEMLQICKAEWCDYVFSDTFNLMPLEEVKAFINREKHLPNCTSAEKIAKDGGFSLEEEIIRQQEKIEEIYLHLINSEKRLEALNGKLIKLSLDSMQKLLPIAAAYQGEEYSGYVSGGLHIECFQIKPAPNGIGGLIISPDIGPYTVSWSGPVSGNIQNLPCADGAIQIPNLLAGAYVVTVSNASGSIGTCSFSISNIGNSVDCEIFNDPFCKQSVLDLIKSEAFNTPPSCKQWEGDPCSNDDAIFRVGNVGIGTSVGRSGYSLAVKGGIVTDKFRVELCESGPGWCDFVFDNGYPIQSLDNINAYIQEHRHLPGTISQSEVVEEGGFEVRNVKLDHQIKIEEAYLHLIELNKKKEALKLRINSLYND